jgi:hypothetical protein
MEEQIIFALDFDLQSDGPLPFLERYQRVLGIDLESQNQLYFKIGYSSRKLLRHMMHKATFLSYRPSQVAATAILVAIDLNKAEKRSVDRAIQGENGPSALGKFNSMLLKDDQELHLHQAKSSVSPPSQSNAVTDGFPKSNSPQSNTYGDQSLDKAWTR